MTNVFMSPAVPLMISPVPVSPASPAGSTTITANRISGMSALNHWWEENHYRVTQSCHSSPKVRESQFFQNPGHAKFMELLLENFILETAML